MWRTWSVSLDFVALTFLLLYLSRCAPAFPPRRHWGGVRFPLTSFCYSLILVIFSSRDGHSLVVAEPDEAAFYPIRWAPPSRAAESVRSSFCKQESRGLPFWPNLFGWRSNYLFDLSASIFSGCC
jgi:hypothetical protein